MAKISDRLSVSLQENLLVLLCFSARAAPLIRNAVEPRLFSSQQYCDVAVRAYDYLDRYKKPPGEHLPDLFGDIAESSDAEGKQLVALLEDLYRAKETVNEDYALAQLEHFVRQQSLKGSIIAASEALQEGDLESAEEELQKGLKQRLAVFSPGISLADGVRAAYGKQVRRDIVPTGIQPLDDAHLGPARGEFHLFIGPPKRGKSWWLIHMTKHCLLQRLKTVYVSLELSEAQIAQRLLQSLFSLTRHKTRVPVTRLRLDDLGRLLEFSKETLSGRMSIDDASTRPIVEKKLKRMYGADNLVIKQFPAGALTVPGLRAYLEMLERAAGFVPDMLVIDYPDYMKIDPRNYRFEIGAVYNDLRGLAVERNIGVVAAKRSNREGTSAKMVTEIHAAEDYSAIYTADTIFTYSQTAAEKELGLARLFVSNTRVADSDGFVLLMSQAYPVGQFCLEAVRMHDTYWSILKASGEQAGGNED